MSILCLVLTGVSTDQSQANDVLVAAPGATVVLVGYQAVAPAPAVAKAPAPKPPAAKPVAATVFVLSRDEFYKGKDPKKWMVGKVWGKLPELIPVGKCKIKSANLVSIVFEDYRHLFGIPIKIWYSPWAYVTYASDDGKELFTVYGDLSNFSFDLDQGKGAVCPIDYTDYKAIQFQNKALCPPAPK
jgi:hypothetical protein